ncbi:MCE family protein [Streptomyces sp. B1866]|uniref:MCE family protein n=1 Tax=Streptomyces sp. B1866 TaxID=3075431 RepID=UPI00288F0387|nr:MCE family protein [Streptomyces sp. B1866]MDT3397041.1 MCE family protein [Streptomyces sp. B1866]
MNRRSLTGPVVKSSIFVLVTAFTTAVLAFSIASPGVGESRAYNARFTDTTGLIEGDSVRIAGVVVGSVESIKVVDKRFANVKFTVKKGRHLPAGVTASIKYLNLVGQRYIDLRQGVGPVDRELEPGSTIPVNRTAPALDLTLLFNGFKPLFAGLSPSDTNQLAGEIIEVFQGESGTVTSLVRTIGSLSTTLAKKDEVIGRVITNLKTVADTFNNRETEFVDLVGSLDKVVAGFSGDRRAIGDAISSLGPLTVSTGELFGEARQPLKQSIHELGRLSENLADNTPLVEKFLKNTPGKMRAVTRITSYGSWLNTYLCEAKISGVTTYDGSTPPSGVPVTAARCKS